MPWIIVSVAASVFGVFTLLILYSYLYYYERKTYLGIWTLSWGVYLLGQIFSFIQLFSINSSFISISILLTVVFNCLLLIYGNMIFIGKPLKKIWIYSACAEIVWCFSGEILGLSFIYKTLPVLIFSAMAYILIGYNIIKNWKRGYIGTKLLGWLFIIWGIHKIDYPFFRSIKWIAPWGYSFGALIAIVIYANIIIYYIKSTRTDLKESEEHFRLFAENAKDILYHIEFTPKLTCRYVSPAITAIIGYTPEEFYNDDELILKVIVPEYRYLLGNIYNDNTDHEGIFITKWISRSGDIIWMEHHHSPIYSKGVLSAIEGIARDITERKQMEERLVSTRESIIQTLIKALEARDVVTENHSDRLRDIIEEIAFAIGIGDSKLNDLQLLAQFHDIGKVGIPDRILFKPGRLSQDEFEEMKSHSEIGWRIAQSSLELKPISEWILKHHEWWNGKGYPFGLRENEIPIECRILTIADAYDAMTNDRPYRKAMSHEEAVEELKRCSGTQFDPNLLQIAIEVLNKENRGLV